MLPRLEFRELIDAIQDVGHEFFEEDPWGHADLAAQPSGHGLGQVADVVGVAGRGDPLRGLGMLLEDVADLAADLAKPIEVEARQPNLHGARVVEAGLGLKIDVQPLGQGFQALGSLGAIEERRRSRDEQLQARKAAGVDLVDKLPQGVESLVADVAADPLDGLHFVQDQEQPRMPGVPQVNQ